MVKVEMAANFMEFADATGDYSMTEQRCFQDIMPGGECFGCGENNHQGLQIQSYWQGEKSICEWQPETHHQGWDGLTCGGIIATLVDCHCMATAMAYVIREEGRALDSEPYYRFATGSLSVRFIKPTPVNAPLLLTAQVLEVKGKRKYRLSCEVLVAGQVTAEAEVEAFLVWRSDENNDSAFSGA